MEAALAQTAAPTTLPLPTAVPSGTSLRVDGSKSMELINRALKQQFEAQYQGTTVNLAAQGTDAALKGVLDSSVDIAAVGRPLTDAEKGQGLVEVPISREKIAIVVGPNNPFKGDLTFEQFARIYRGEITNWSEVGGTAGSIKVVDRPDSSDTRRALGNYSVFKTAPFKAAPTAVRVAEDSTADIIAQLGNNGISYATANQVLGQSNVRIISMHQTLPDDPRYPYSQPRSYVYKQAANPAVLAFLGYAASPAGQRAIAAAKTEEATAAATLAPSPVSPSPIVSPTATPSAAAAPTATDAGDRATIGWWPWLLLPLAGLLGLLAWGLRGRSGAVTRNAAATVPVAPPPQPTPEPTKLVERTGAVIAADRTGSGQPVSPVPAVEATPAPASPPAPIHPAVVGAAVAGAAAAGIAGLKRGQQSRIVLTPRTAEQGYAYWEAPDSEKAALRQQGGEYLTLRIADVTGLAPDHTRLNMQEYRCSETDVDRFVALPQTERDYIAEIGYLTRDRRWLMLARSAPVRVAAPPAAHPSEAATIPAVTAPIVAESKAAPALDIAEQLSSLPVEPLAEPVVEPVVAREAAPAVNPVAADLPVSPIATVGAMAAGAALVGSDVASNIASEPLAEPVEPVEPVATTPEIHYAAASDQELATVDQDLSELPLSYSESWITLLPRDPQWAYAYWDAPDEQKQALRQQGGQRLALRFYDVTHLDLEHQKPHSLQQYECDEMAQDWYIPVPISDRDYIVEIGYVTNDGSWLILARSNAVRIPPIDPANWYEEQFLTIDWEDELRGQTFLELVPPDQKTGFDNPIYDRIFGLAELAEAQRVTGSLFGSMQSSPEAAVSSFALGSGVGLSERTESGIGMSGVGMMSGIGMSGAGMSGMSGVGIYSISGAGMMSGIGIPGAGISGMKMSGIGRSGAGMMSGVGMMSGIGMYRMSGAGMSGIGVYGMSGAVLYGMSGIGFSGMGMSGIGMMSGAGMYSSSGIGMSGIGFASMPSLRARKFWLLADAELIIYGATEPDATVTIAGRPVQLNPDGTFRFQMSFQDGLIDFPILAVAVDGEQTRSVHLKFNRETLSRFTNSRDEAQDQPY
jgi:ABC-type phosphate transport system substrate-binding protein